MTATLPRAALAPADAAGAPEIAVAAPAARPTPPEVLVLALAFLLPVVFSPRVFTWFTAPKAALLLVAAGPALVSLVLAALARDRAAVLGTLFVGACIASTLGADMPTMALLGGYRAPNGLVFVAVLVGIWSLGRRLGPDARRLLVPVIVAGALVNAAVGIFQVYVDLGPEWLEPFDGRALGLMNNPVHLAGLCAGAAFLAAAASLASTRRWVWVAAVFVLVAAVELSGSRIAIAAVALGVGWLLVRHRRAAIPALLAAVAAVAITLAVPAQAGSGSSARLADAAGSGLSSRVHTWEDGLAALTERPVLGYGPARFFAASAPRTSLESARYTGGDLLYGDAHNIVVEYLVTTGIVGFGLGFAWVLVAARRARGALAGFCAVVLATMLFEPQYVGLTPLVALAFGAAGPTVNVLPPSRRWQRVGRAAVIVGLCSAIAGAALGTALVVGDARFRDAVDRSSLQALDAAEPLLPAWPQMPALRGVLFASAAERLSSRDLGRAALRAEQGAVDRDPADPQWWWLRGQLAESFGTPREAAGDYRRALARNPWSVEAMTGMMRVAYQRGDRAAAERWRAQLCQIGPAACVKRAVLSELEVRPAVR